LTANSPVAVQGADRMSTFCAPRSSKATQRVRDEQG